MSPGILRHGVIGATLGIMIFFMIHETLVYLSVLYLLFITFNIIPDLIFLPYLILKHNTVDPKILLETKDWKELSRLDELVALVLGIFIFLLFPHSIVVIVILSAIFVHIICDLLVREKTIWW